MRRILRYLAPALLGLALLMPAGLASAAPPRVDRTIDIRQIVNTCNGETVELVGTVHYVIQPNPDGTTTWLVQIHSEGVGDQGNEYVFNFQRQSVFDASGGFELKGTARAVLVSKGSAPNQNVTFIFDFTGETPVFDLEENCTG